MVVDVSVEKVVRKLDDVDGCQTTAAADIIVLFSWQVLSCLLQEQRVVLFSADWARLTLVAECFLLYLQVCPNDFSLPISSTLMN